MVIGMETFIWQINVVVQNAKVESGRERKSVPSFTPTLAMIKSLVDFPDSALHFVFREFYRDLTLAALSSIFYVTGRSGVQR